MRYLLFLIPLLISTSSCKKKPAPVPDPPIAPAKAVLISPAQNEACNNGTVISATQSSVQLKWAKSDNTDSYDVVVKNLETGASTTASAGANLQLDIALIRNTPYSWYVVSKSSASNSTAQSDVWKFYNAGPATAFYPPYPADAMSPAMGTNVTAVAGKITLSWTGSDADNDIASYDVYLGTTNSPSLLSNVTASPLTNVTVSAGTTYYWKVVTRDARGNTSDSGIYQFRVN